MTRKTRITLGSIAGALLLLGIAALGVWEYITTPYEGHEAQWVRLPRGTTPEAMRDSLDAALGERTAARVMRLYKAMAADSVAPRGAYLIEPGTSAKEIARRLARHRQTPVRVTFNNIRTLPQLSERIARQMELTPAEFLAACDSLLPAAGFRGVEQYPAAFLPDTYEFYWTAPAADVVGKLLEVRNEFWTPERREQAKALGVTPVEVATLASIAEEETNDRGERGEVARLYLNRVHRGMKLQADPTVKFALSDFSLRRIRGEHLKVKSPYNTYYAPGLPPGPIRIPTAQTLRSVLEAPEHDYIFMCAKEDFSGRHNFAADYATHRANARRYQQALNKRGIK